MSAGDRPDPEPATYHRLLALNTAMRLRRSLHTGPVPAQRDSADGPRDGDQLLLKESLELVAPAAANMVTHFYATLFHNRPYLRELFPVVMDVQRDRLLNALLTVVGKLDEPALLVPLLQQLGRDHRKFGVRPVHYAAVGDALISSLRRYAGDAWRPEFEEAWLRAFTFAADAMTAAALDAEPSPPFWRALVVSHERRLDDLAVLTLRPDPPYDYVPGQFATLESALKPRTWRPYSMATAPTRHGLLEFHIRMVGAGWVSRALVRQVRPGDVLRVGPPVGELTLAAAEPERDLLLVGGGTGLAPLKAIVDGMSTVDTRRVTLLVAARNPAELYDLEALSALVARRPPVTLIVAIERYDVPRTFPATVTAVLLGRADEALRQLGDISARETFLAGPPSMLHTCLTTLTDLGVCADRTHFDVPFSR